MGGVSASHAVPVVNFLRGGVHFRGGGGGVYAHIVWTSTYSVHGGFYWAFDSAADAIADGYYQVVVTTGTAVFISF